MDKVQLGGGKVAKQTSTIGATPVSSPAIPAAVELAVTRAQAAQLASLMQSSHLILALAPWPPQGSMSGQTGQPGQPTVSQQSTQPAQSTGGQPSQPVPQQTAQQPAQAGQTNQPKQQ